MALSVGDILTALVYIPTHIINVNVSLDVPCNGLGIEQFFTIFLGTSATILTTIICMDRYIFISRPCQRMLSSPSSPSNQRRHSTRKIFIVYCIVTYSISFSFSITAYQNITLNNSYRSSLKYSILSFVIYTVMLLASLGCITKRGAFSDFFFFLNLRKTIFFSFINNISINYFSLYQCKIMKL